MPPGSDTVIEHPVEGASPCTVMFRVAETPEVPLSVLLSVVLNVAELMVI
jgi:hypothetical protein